ESWVSSVARAGWGVRVAVGEVLQGALVTVATVADERGQTGFVGDFPAHRAVGQPVVPAHVIRWAVSGAAGRFKTDRSVEQDARGQRHTIARRDRDGRLRPPRVTTGRRRRPDAPPEPGECSAHRPAGAGAALVSTSGC